MFPLFLFPKIISARWLFPVWCRSVPTSEVREATGIFNVLIRNEENTVLEFIVAEFLKRDGSCDRGENRDVCERDNDRSKSC